jgi:hypothetical protein
MALKADRHEARTDISFFMNTTGNRGVIVVHDTSASGAGMDAAAAVVKIPTAGFSGSLPAGLLLCDVVNYDLTRQHINWHKDEVQIGGKVTLLKDGWVVTNAVSGSPTAGQTAYYDQNGNLTPTDGGGGVKVGRFLTSKDADGYAKVDINITG